MKKNQPRARRLRKCEVGRKTKNFNKGCRYYHNGYGFQPIGFWNRHLSYFWF